MKYAAVLLVWCTALSAADRIVVIAHRGEHRAHPENTLPAFQAAIDAGADSFELDVRTTSDGRLVLMHDARVDRTTNGSGAVRAMTFDQIRALDAGAKFSPQFAGTKVPSLDWLWRTARSASTWIRRTSRPPIWLPRSRRRTC